VARIRRLRARERERERESPAVSLCPFGSLFGSHARVKCAVRTVPRALDVSLHDANGDKGEQSSQRLRSFELGTFVSHSVCGNVELGQTGRGSDDATRASRRHRPRVVSRRRRRRRTRREHDARGEARCGVVPTFVKGVEFWKMRATAGGNLRTILYYFKMKRANRAARMGLKLQPRGEILARGGVDETVRTTLVDHRAHAAGNVGEGAVLGNGE